MLVAHNLTKRYAAHKPITVVEDVALTVRPGESVAIMGPSGSGKSTLLYMLGALEPPSSGTVEIDGTNPYELGEAAQAAFRGAHVGFVFQDHLLLPQLSAEGNVLVPTLAGRSAEPAATVRQRAHELLDAVGLAPRRDHRPAELSGGERQRVAIARALIRQPAVVLCDEPTGNLDAASADAVADLLIALHQQRATVLVAVTHSAAFAARFGKRFQLRDRQLHPVP